MLCGVFEFMSLRVQIEVYVILCFSREDLPFLLPSLRSHHLSGINTNSVMYLCFNVNN